TQAGAEFGAKQTAREGLPLGKKIGHGARYEGRKVIRRLRSIWRGTRSWLGASATIATTVLVGNKQDWRDALLETALSPVKSCPYPLDAQTIALPEVDFVLPFLLSEYDLIRASPIALRKSLIPPAAGVALADDKLTFNN